MTIDNCVIDMDWRGITIHVAYVIRKEKNKYLLDVISPYEALYCSVFGVQADTLSYSQDGMCRRMFDELIEKLNYRERTVISELYGYGRERQSISDIAAELECDTDEVDRLKDSALGRLRDPDNYIYLEKRWYSGNDITNTENELDYKGKLQTEILRYLSGQNTDIDYITAVMKRNNISVKRVYRNVPAAEPGGDRFEAIFAGKKNIDETIKALREFKISAKPVESIRKKRTQRGNIETVLISQDGVEQAYKYSGLSDEDVAECVYHVLTDSEEGHGCILDFNIPDSLMGLLLLHGYLYLGSLVDDREDIYRGLSDAGFDMQAEEFSKFADKAEVYIADRTHASMTFVVVPPDAARQICDDDPVDYHELLSSAEAVNREFAVMLIRNAKREFADFAGLTVTEAARNKLQTMGKLMADDTPADAV